MGLRDGDKALVRESEGAGPIQDFLAETARRHGIWLVGGSMPLVASTPDKVLNTSLVFNPQGERVGALRQDSSVRFEKGGERYNECVDRAGCEPVGFDTPFGQVGLSICYDMRFPELYRRLGVVDLLVIPAAFTETTGRAHWEILLRARAIENQCYVLAIAQGGLHENRRETHGNSMLIDPWGLVLTGETRVKVWWLARWITHALPKYAPASRL